MMRPQLKPLTSKMVECLCDLYSESGGDAGTMYLSTVHWNVIEGLYKRGLIMRDAQIERGKVTRYIALTQSGADYSCEKLEAVINDNGISDSRSQKCVSLFFEYDEKKYPHHVNAYKHVGKLKAERNFRPTMIELLNIDEELERGETGLLEELYPEAIQALQAKIRQQLEMEYYEKILSKLDTLQSPEPSPNQGLRPLSSGNVGLKANTGAIGLSGGLGQTMSAPSPVFDDPVFDDDEDFVLDIKADKTTNANANLIKSMLGLQG